MAPLRIGQKRLRSVDALGEIVTAEHQVAEHGSGDAIHFRLRDGEAPGNAIPGLFQGDEPRVEEGERPGEGNDNREPDRQEDGGDPGRAQNMRPANRAGASVTARMKPTIATTMAPKNAAQKSWTAKPR